MRKEAKRSLVFWPAAASATIVAVTWFAKPDGPPTGQFAMKILEGSVGRNWPTAPVFSWNPKRTMDAGEQAVANSSDRTATRFFPVAATPQFPAPIVATRGVDVPTAPILLKPEIRRPEVEADVAERTERGGRAMKVPGRLHDVFTVSERKSLPLPPVPLSAPVRNEQFETAGMVDHEEDNATSPSDMVGARPFVGPPRPGAERSSLLSNSASVSGRVMLPPSDQKETARLPRPTSPKRGKLGQPGGWPVTTHLDAQLSAIRSLESEVSNRLGSDSLSTDQSELTLWVKQVEVRLADLRGLPRIGHDNAGRLIKDLSLLAERGLEQAETLDDRAVQIQWLHIAHSIARRTAVWMPIWQLAQSEPTGAHARIGDGQLESITSLVERVRNELNETGDIDGWSRYLMLDEIASHSPSGPSDDRRVVAQRFLSRLQWHGLDREHRRWLDRPSIQELAVRVRPWSQSAVDYAELLGQIERQESDAIDLAAIDISGAVQSLRFADDLRANEVAQVLDLHYRNANVRMAISESLLQRLLPAVDKKTVPVRTQMLGSQVRGTSQIDSELKIHLIPSPDRWAFELQTDGHVRSRSTGVNGPVAVRTLGNSKFSAAAPVEISSDGIQFGEIDVDVNGQTRLRGIDTDYDGWPLVGSLFKSYAQSEYRSVAKRSNQIANRQIGSKVVQEIETELDTKADRSAERLEDFVLGPLGRLRLDPKVVDMQTTGSRLLARYRLAGDWQLGAFTPRPRAPRSSWMSLQVHQSALNNTLEQLVPRDEPGEITEIIQNGMRLFGREDAKVPEDIPEGVRIQFAKTRPITVEIKEGEFWVTLRVMRMTRGTGLDLKRFIVRAVYRPEMEGMNARLVREGHLSISGPGMSMRQRLPVRAIFNKVLSSKRAWNLTMPQWTDHPAAENLAISQLELREGWIAMAVSPADAPKIALQRKRSSDSSETTHR